MSAKRIIWIISEGSPGHVSQSTGLAAALAEKFPVETRQLECRPKIKGFVRHLIRLLWMGKTGRPLPDSWLYGPIGLERPNSDEPAPDLIISSGGRSVFAARTLAVKHGVPFVFLGERKPYPPEWFHTVFTPSSLEIAPNDLRMDVIPTKITPEVVHQAAADWENKPTGRLWTMLIGGKSRSHDFQNADWEKLAEGMTALAKTEGIRWLVTTSRRTGKDVESKLRDLLPPEIIADAVWWCHQPEKKFPAYLGAAEAIWVTQDSVSMVTEAVATDKPVVVIQPAHTPFPATSFMPGYLANLESLGLISRLPIARLTEVNRDFLTHPRPAIKVTEIMADQLCQRLKWN
ncbi:MAG: ELM1/GtrOC1 family putative glycosyltransferase [Luteolibacter sp.]